MPSIPSFPSFLYALALAVRLTLIAQITTMPIMKRLCKVLSVYLLVLFCAAACFIVSGGIPGFLPEGDFPQGSMEGKEEPKRGGGESFGLVAATNLLYAQGASGARTQNHKAVRLSVVALLVMFLFCLQRLFVCVIKNSCCHIFNFLRCLAVSLVLCGHAPPFHRF
jgi:hypothetical protein